MRTSTQCIATAVAVALFLAGCKAETTTGFAPASGLKALTLGVTVSGPSQVNPAVSPCSYSASVSGGTTPYTYHWYKNDTLYFTGTGHVGVHFDADIGTLNFWIKVNVTDAATPSNSGTDSMYVQNGSQYPKCP